MKVLFFACLLSTLAYGQTRVYEGKALREGKHVYTEKHTVTWLDKKVLSSVTVYTSPLGKVLATLKNDYSKSLNMPENEMDDLMMKNKYGIRYQGAAPLMYRIENGKEEKKAIKDEAGKLLVGGQGLHYHIIEHMDEIIRKGKLDLKFVIPGKLDAYDFYLKVAKVMPGKVEFDVEIDNWFLRLFAPGLKLIYDTKEKRLLRYSGLSNIQNDKKEIMNVEIEYKY
jgi:hypothetical protein